MRFPEGNCAFCGVEITSSTLYIDNGRKLYGGIGTPQGTIALCQVLACDDCCELEGLN